MPIPLPDWIVAKVGPSFVAVDGSFGVSDVADTDEVKYSEIISALDCLTILKVEVVQLRSVHQWRYAEISVSGNVVCELVEVPPTWGIGRPPSAVENAVIQAWFVDQQYDPDELCARFSNTALLCWHPGRDIAVSSDAVLAAAGLSKRQEALALEAPLRTKTRISLGEDSSLLATVGSGVYARLFQRALSESHVELRFLYFYRVFERAYLASAYAKLSAGFFEDPRRALSVAEATVSNERRSFISLIESSHDVDSWFALIYEEALATSSSQFLRAIRRSCDKDGWLSDKEAWRRGGSICYKIRCAIVHSGERGPIFEEFGDAEAACATLVPYLEQAAISFLKIHPA